jgi:hypothetical protein
MLVSVESTSHRFFASGAVVPATTVLPLVLVLVLVVLVLVPELVVVVIVVPLLVVVVVTVVVLVAASAGAPVSATVAVLASVADRMLADHLPPRKDRRLELLFICSP